MSIDLTNNCDSSAGSSKVFLPLYTATGHLREMACLCQDISHFGLVDNKKSFTELGTFVLSRSCDIAPES